MLTSPQSCEELLQRAHALAGRSLHDIAEQLGISAKVNLKREKGWMGQLIELALGATSGSLPQPDFPQLQIELKTLPVDRHGRPLESTWVCVAPLLPAQISVWENSLVYHKLRQVLWLPIIAERGLPISARQVGSAWLWQASTNELSLLQRDYEEITERIMLGEIEQLSAHTGVALQLRPKAANRRVTARGIGPDGTTITTAPRGFYLRRRFTEQLMQSHYL
jgi:DNA mismatch repair protein MutH